MPNNHGGARKGAGRTRVNRQISKAAAQALEERAADLEADRLLTVLVLTASPETWAVVREIVKEMGEEGGVIPDATGKPIIL